MTEVLDYLLYFVLLTFSGDVLWIVFPLLISTIIMLVYFEKYHSESPGWNTYVANSLVLVFVSIILLRELFLLDGAGAVNYVAHYGKFFVSVALLFLGFVILSLNFEHFFPEKIARNMSSPLTINLLAYIAILYVVSPFSAGWTYILSLLIYFVLVFLLLFLIRIPVRKLFAYLSRMKERDKIQEIVSTQKTISEKEKEIKKEENLLKRQKKVIRTGGKKLNVKRKKVKKRK